MSDTKDFLGLKDVPFSVIDEILSRSVFMKQAYLGISAKAADGDSLRGSAAQHDISHILRGKRIAALFYENSTRTRVSFELAAKALGAGFTSISVAQSSVQKGETLVDNGKTLDAMAIDAVVIRHEAAGAPHLLARTMRASVINAGDGLNEHPTQALLDMLTIRERLGGFKGLRVVIAGDIKHSRVARSDIWGLTKAGADVTVCAPDTLMPRGIEMFPVRAERSLAAAARGADVLMALRLQLERQGAGLFPSIHEYNALYGIDGEIAALASPRAIVMHPGPLNRNAEICGDTADGGQSMITGQVTNGIAVRMALLERLLT